jgi:hypothetical protein
MRYAEEHPVYSTVLVSACHTDLGDEHEALSGYALSPNYYGIEIYTE